MLICCSELIYLFIVVAIIIICKNRDNIRNHRKLSRLLRLSVKRNLKVMWQRCIKYSAFKYKYKYKYKYK